MTPQPIPQPGDRARLQNITDLIPFWFLPGEGLAGYQGACYKAGGCIYKYPKGSVIGVCVNNPMVVLLTEKMGLKPRPSRTTFPTVAGGHSETINGRGETVRPRLGARLSEASTHLAVNRPDRESSRLQAGEDVNEEEADQLWEEKR